MYLITLVHTVPYSICILWGWFVNADGSQFSGMRTKAVLEIKTGSSDFRICYPPQNTRLSHSHSISLMFGQTVIILSLDKQEVKPLYTLLCNNLDSPRAVSLLNTCYLKSPVFILSAFAFALLANLHSRTVTCTCQSCIVRIQHIPLAWRIWFTWSRCSLTADERAWKNSPFSFYWTVHSQTVQSSQVCTWQ